MRPRGRLQRRDLLKAVFAGSAAGLLVAGADRAASAAPPGAPAPARAKVSQAMAEYQDHPKDIRACATCTLFLPPDACKVVLGKVSRDGWCNLYDIAD